MPVKSKEQLRIEAEARHTEYGKLTPDQRLARLDNRPGECRRERGRVLKDLAKRAKMAGVKKSEVSHMTDNALASAVTAAERRG